MFFVVNNSAIAIDLKIRAKTESIDRPQGESDSFRLTTEPLDNPNLSKEKEKNKDINSNIHRRRLTELLENVLLHKNTVFNTIKLSITKFFSYHFLACIITSLVIIFQNFYDKTCYLYPICNCHDDLFTKILAAIKDVISFWSFIGYIMFNSIFFLQEMRTKLILKIFFYLVNVSYIIYTYLGQNGDTESQNTITIYLMGHISLVFFFALYLIFLKFDFKKWRINMFDASGLDISFIVFYMSAKFFLPFIKINIKNNMDEHLGKNVFQFIIWIYTKIMVFVLQYFLWRYFRVLSREAIKKDEITLRLTFMVRFSLCYIISINIATILRMTPDDWGGWLLILSYALFVLKSYTRIDIYSILLLRVYKFFFNK